jgi:type VI secretion system VasD/TssJ family lipoprotein
VSVSPNAKYLGFVASYRNINNGRWRSIVQLNPGSKTTYINLNLESRGFSAKKNTNKHFWNKF